MVSQFLSQNSQNERDYVWVRALARTRNQRRQFPNVPAASFRRIYYSHQDRILVHVTCPGRSPDPHENSSNS
jgi:hypothetical protein